MRLKFLDLLAALAGCVLVSAAAAAQSFPTRPIWLIVPFPPAGITDLSARLAAEGLRVKFSQPVIVENKPGANGVLGLREMLKAEPDGYTLMAGTRGTLVSATPWRRTRRSTRCATCSRSPAPPNTPPPWWSTTSRR